MKNKITADKLINWRKLSVYLTGNTNQLTRTRIGLKYKPTIDELREAIEKWIEQNEAQNNN